MLNTVQQDNTQLLHSFIDANLNPTVGKPITDKGVHWAPYGINLIVRPQCTQTCEYCYIYQHGKELYPEEERVTNSVLLKNLDSLLDYYLNTQHYYIRLWTFFAGDLFYDGLYFDIIDVMYPYYEKLYYDHPELWENSPPVEIILPLNISMVYNEDNLHRLDAQIERFNKIQTRLGFSFSTDGKYAEDIREKNHVPDEIWERLFLFIQKHGCGLHPMISAESIERACENYDWWIEQLQKYPLFDGDFWCPSFLEVRNPDVWTSEKIEQYLRLLDHMINHRLQKCNNDIEEFSHNILGQKTTICPPVRSNDLISLHIKDPFIHKGISCGQDFLVSITLNNLNLVPCHRLAYPQFRAGHYALDEQTNKITGLEAHENVHGLINILSRNILFEPGCVACDYNHFCMHGCLGAQYEHSKEIFMPIESVCNLFKSKVDFLLKKYHELGALKVMLEKSMLSKDQKETLIRILQKKGYENYEQYL